MPKGQQIPGKNSQNALWRMSVGLDREHSQFSCQIVNEQHLLTTLKTCGFSPEDVTCIMQDDPTKLTITVTFSVLKKIPEKSGVM